MNEGRGRAASQGNEKCERLGWGGCWGSLGPSICPLQIAMECFNFSRCTLNFSFSIWMCLLPSTKGQSVLNFFAVAFACYKTVPCDFSCLD